MVQRLNFVAQVEAVPNVLGNYVHISDYKLLHDQLKDLDVLRGQAAAWKAVCRVMDEVRYQWHSNGGCGQDAMVTELRKMAAQAPVYRTSPKDSRGYEYQIRGNDIWWRTAQFPNFTKHYVSTAEFLEALVKGGEWDRVRVVCTLAANPHETGGVRT